MDDPWDVKSVRKSGQYTSCMKLNGVPLLPPVLSRECRSEMQYYKLLAKEVEKRISVLQPYVESDDDSEDKTDAPEITECVQDIDVDIVAPREDINHNHAKIADDTKEVIEDTVTNTSHTESYNFSSKQIVTETTLSPTNLILDFSLNINETIRENATKETTPTLQESEMEIPERDYNCIKPEDVEVKNMICKQQQDTIIEEIVNFSFSIGREQSLDSAIHASLSEDSPPSLTSKSFTGSLNNIHMHDSDIVKPLVRQHSYTILNPSPQLLAHLEVQSLNLGVDMSSISMSESQTNLSSPGKKRRSWDLETAKVKWSNMALELKQKDLSRPNNPRKTVSSRPTPRAVSPSRAKCVAAARTKYSTLSLKHTVKNEAFQKNRLNSPPRSRASSPPRTKASSPVRDAPSTSTIILEEPMTFRTGKEPRVSVIKEHTMPKNLNNKKGEHGEGSKTESPKKESLKTPNQRNMYQKTSSPHPAKHSEPAKSPAKSNGASKPTPPKQLLISEAEDPAVKVRELYEKIQRQQLMQMASLVEKQKREQMLLQQAFEEQNNMLFKQLKTICPKSPDIIKNAWTDKVDRGPVSLSQLISPKVPENVDSPLSSTLTDSNKYINYCNEILKKSKDISSTLHTNGKSQKQSSAKQTNLEGSRTRTTSPVYRNTPTSRKLNYDTSVSSGRECEPMLTDRTNDTLADLNVSFPSDSEESARACRLARSPLCAELTLIHRSTPVRSTDSAIKCMEQTIHKSINSCGIRARNIANCQPTARQLAAASVIVAHAKGYLVRRLMRTARVQETVQTIKDALLCALQLHQDREGIRGADVDLHRRLIQQITAACYSLHDTFITSSAGERCAMISADRSRRASLAARHPSKHRPEDVMSQSHSGAFPPRQKRHAASPASLMTQSNYETYSSECGRARYMPSPRRRPWR